MINKTSLNGWRENSISPLVNYQYEKITETISRINQLTEKLVKASSDRLSINPITIANTACHINFYNVELRTLKKDIFESFNKDISQLEKCLNNKKFNIKLFIAENIWDRESFLINNTKPRDEVRNFLHQKGLIKEKELHI
jgi:hypothetical protein